MKFKKRILVFPLYLLTLVGCNDLKGDIVLDDELMTSYELSDKNIFLPTAHLENEGDVTSYDVKYTVYNKDTKEKQTSKYSSFKLSVGEYNITYSIGNKKLVKSFEVKDTTAPVIGFSSVPTDLYIQDITDKKRANLPSTSIIDYSGYDEETLVRTLTRNGESVKVNEILDTYSVDAYGKYTYTVSVSDYYGNSATSSVSWTIKDREYNPTDIKSGLLADYDDNGYTNLINTGKIDTTYSIDSMSDTYLEDKSDQYGTVKTGVFKMSGDFSNVDNVGKNASIQFKLPTQSQFTYEDLKGKYLAFDVMVEGVRNASIQPSVAILGNVAQTDGYYMRALYLRKTITVNKWSTIYIDAEHAARLGLFPESTHDNGSDATFPGGDTTYYNTIAGSVESITLGISDLSSGNTINGFNFYIDSIYLADTILDAPAASESNGVISWDAVEHADKYVINMNGEKNVITDNFISLLDGQGYIKIQAVSDSYGYLNSEETVLIYGHDSSRYTLDDPMYLELWRNSLSFNSTDDFENANYIYKKCSTSINNNALVANLGSSNWAIVNGFSLNLPRIATPGMYDYINIKLKVNKDSLKELKLYSSNYYKGNPLSAVSLTGKANTTIDIKIDLAKVNSNISYLDFVFGIGNATSSMEVTIEAINFVKIVKLDTPNITISNKVLSWDPVNNATGYRIDTYSDGVKATSVITDCSYEIKSTENVVLVTAVDSSEINVDSTTLFFVQDSNVIHPATVVNTEKKSGGYSTTGLIQISGIELDGLVWEDEFSAGQMNITNLKTSKNGVLTSNVMSELHYHNNITPKLFQPHFNSSKANDILTIHGYEKSSFFSAYDPELETRFYYVLDSDLNITNNGNRLVLA